MAEAAAQTSSEYIGATAKLNQGLQKFYIYLGFFRRALGPPFTFQKLSIIIGLIVLIVMLALVATAFYALNKNRMHPPSIAECPDYFLSDSNGGCKQNPNNQMGKCGDDVPDFKTGKYKGQNGYKEKYNWARKCHVQWDGITNNRKYTKIEGDTFD